MLQASAAGASAPLELQQQLQQNPELYFTPAQQQELARGVEKVTSFPLDGGCAWLVGGLCCLPACSRRGGVGGRAGRGWRRFPVAFLNGEIVG